MITSTKRGGNERSAAQFVQNLCEQRTRKPVLRHGAERGPMRLRSARWKKRAVPRDTGAIEVFASA
jgi:hypothetical protein